MKINPDYKSRFRILKGGKIALVVSTLFGTMTLLSAAPSDGAVTTGTATISQTTNTTTINQTTQKASINWQSFSVAPTETVNFVQPSSSSVTLNRVVGVTNSLIEGTINANGQVFLLNPNGIVFSKGSSVNVGGLVASTLDISDEDFQNGNYTLSGSSTNSVLNMGTITANSGGYVVLAGKTVSNEGLIKATLGDIHLVGASKVSLNINGNSLIKLTIDKGILDALVENKGIIQADGGEVYLTTQALDTVLNGVVNNRGIIEADSIDTQDGKIILFAHGGTTNIDGTLSAKDGFIETSGTNLSVASSTDIKTKTWLLDPIDITIESSGGTDLAGSSIKATTIATALNGGTDVILQADNDINVNESIDWTQSLLALNAGNDININAILSATNTAGLSLLYAQTTSTGTYNIHAPINLASTGSFSTKYSTDAIKNYTIITSLGAESSTTGTDLQGINGNLSGQYVLGSNIDASITTSWNSGAGFVPIGDTLNKFTGSFDGLGHTVSDLFINRPTTDNVGLFGSAFSGTTIQNVGLTNVNITGQNNVGGLIGKASTTITNTYVTGSITGNHDIGGLIGYLSSATKLNNSYSLSNINGAYNIGGLVGHSYYGIITNSYSKGSVTGTNYVGGVIGLMDGSGMSIENSYSNSTVSGDGIVGGFVGKLVVGSIKNSYSAGDITGVSSTGGFGGINDSGTIENSFWDSVYSNDFGAITGTGTSINSYRVTSIGMQTAFKEAYYSGFDFADTWAIHEGYSHPILRTLLTPLIVTVNNTTKTYDGNIYSGSNSVTYSTTPNANLLGTVIYAGTSQSATDAGTYSTTATGLYSYDQQGYVISYIDGALTIDKKPITATYTAENKVYDGATTAIVSGSSANIISSDNVSFLQTANFDDENVGVGKTVNINGIALGGVDGGNYSLVNNTAIATADITDIPINQPFDTSEIKQIKTPVKNGIAFRTDNIITPNNLLNATIFSQTKITNNGVKLPVGLMNNEEL